MAAQDPTLCESQDAADWDQVDAGVQTDMLTGMTDDNTATGIKKIGKSPDDVMRAEYASLKNKDANGTVTVYWSSDHNVATLACLPYSSATGVDTSEKLTYTVSAGSPATFTLPQTFLDALHDLGSGKGAIRITEDLGISGDIFLSEIDADFTEAAAAHLPPDLAHRPQHQPLLAH